MLLILEELSILLCLGLPSFAFCCTTLSITTFLGLRCFLVLPVNFMNDLLDTGIGIGFNEMTEQVSEAEEVPKSSDGIIFL